MKRDLDAPDSAKAPETQLTVASLGFIAEHLSQPVYAKNAQLEFVLLNTTSCQWLGREREDLLGRTERDVFGPELGEPHEATDREVLQHELPVTAEEQFPDGEGTLQSRPVTKLPITDASGVVTHVVCVVGHAGESAASAQQLEEELERYAMERTRALQEIQEDRLKKERLMVLGQLAAGLAHQIRNPLAAIANALALARRQMPTDASELVKEALRIANDEIWVANRIIGDLLEFARIPQAVPGDVPLLEMVQGALDQEPVGSHIAVELQVPPLVVRADSRQVRDALRNLVRNAGEAMPTAGTLTFQAEPVGAFAELRISDTGEGIPGGHRHLLFEPLVTSKPFGIGLGLPTARALIANQGGTLECVESTERGACFSIRLPLATRGEERDAD